MSHHHHHTGTKHHHVTDTAQLDLLQSQLKDLDEKEAKMQQEMQYEVDEFGNQVNVFGRGDQRMDGLGMMNQQLTQDLEYNNKMDAYDNKFSAAAIDDKRRGKHQHMVPKITEIPEDFREIKNPNPQGQPLTEKQQIVIKLRSQNEQLKDELKTLSSKLEDFMEKQRQKKINQVQKQANGAPGSNPYLVPTKVLQTYGQFSNDPTIQMKEKELRDSQAKIQFYKKEIENMRRQLEESYNIQKITQLEDEQKNKKRILKQLQEENRALVKVQKDQEKALQSLSKENDYEKKIAELNVELKQAKDHLRKLQIKKRDDERSMKTQHETLVALDDKCRKMAQIIKEKKIKRQQTKEKQNAQDVINKQYTKEDLTNLENQLKIAESDKLIEEKRLKEQLKLQEQQIKSLQNELGNVTHQVKEKDQEYRLNELKIKELRRQLPQKVLRPIDNKAQQNMKKINMLGQGLRQESGTPDPMMSQNFNSAQQLPPMPKNIIQQQHLTSSTPNLPGHEQMQVIDTLKKRKNSNSRIMINTDEGNIGPQGSLLDQQKSILVTPKLNPASPSGTMDDQQYQIPQDITQINQEASLAARQQQISQQQPLQQQYQLPMD